MKTIKVKTPDIFQKVLQLRHDVFVNEQGVAPSLEIDEYDTLDHHDAHHFALVIKEDVVIGACRCIIIDGDIIRLGRFCIHKALRHQGFGLKFLRAVHDYFYRKQYQQIIIHAQDQAISFYTNAGYRSHGEPFLEAGIVHQTMILQLYQQFYTRFSNVYDEIFPLHEAKQNMIEEFIEDKQTLCDVGCATGAVLELMESKNKQALGFDADEAMVKKAQARNTNAILLDMKDMDFIHQTFDGITILGNTMVHLDSLNQIKQFLMSCKDHLNDNGELFIQNVNFNRVLHYDQTTLPTLTNSNGTIRLKRQYEKADGLVFFQNRLIINKRVYKSSVTLYPLLPDTLKDLLKQLNFEILNEYGSYHKEPFDLEHSLQHLIIARKKSPR